MLKKGRPSPAEIRDSVLAYIHARGPGRPILVGDVCLHLGWWATIRDTEVLLETLVEEHVIEPMPSTECALLGLTHAYRLKTPPV